MYLGNIKRRIRYSVIHPLGRSDLPNQMPEEELHAKVEAYKQGDDSVKEDLILGHMRLTLQICGGYINRYPYKKNDIVSAAMLGLVKAVDWSRTRLKNGNIAGYITTTVHSHISNFLRTDKLIKGNCNLVPYTIKISSIKYDEENWREYYNEAEATLLPPQYDEDDIMVTDLINQFLIWEQKIIKMKLQGYTNTEIAKRLGVSKEWIGQSLVKIQKKLKRRMK